MSELNGAGAAPDFSQFAALQVEGKRRWFPMPKLGKLVRVEGVCSNPKANIELTVGKLKLSGQRDDILNERDADRIRRDREEDVELYSTQILTAWEGVVDAKGQSVPFGPTSAAAFLRSIPSHIFLDLRFFFQKIENFEDEIKTDAVAGNLSAGSSGT